MKRLLFFFLLIITGFAYGQNPIATKELRVHPRTDSVTVSNIGKIGFDADDDKLRFSDGVSWYSYIKEGATLPYWPLSGNFSTTGAQSITKGGNTEISMTNAHYSISALGGHTEVSSLLWLERVSPGLLNATLRARGSGTLHLESENMLHIESQDSIRIESGNGIFLVDIPDVLDTAAYVLVRENSTGEVKRRSVSSISSSGAFMPLTGTADLTGDVEIEGGGAGAGINSINFGIPEDPLLKLNIVADEEFSINTGKITKQFVGASGFVVETRQFSATVLDNTASQQNVVHTIDVSSPAVAYYNLRITSALAVNTANGRIISCNPFTAIAEMDTGTLSGTSAAPVNVYHGGPTTGGFNVNFNDTADEIEIRFLNETGTGFQWSISVEYELMIAQ